jgi:beta-glucuronidase
MVMIPAAADYEGSITYRKKFVVGSEAVASGAFTFVSYGINYRVEVFINEVFIGAHEGGSTSFEIPVPDNLIQMGAENIIRVVADNSLDHRTTLPLRPQITGWKNYNGLLRDIFIVSTPRVWIDDVDVVTEAIEPKATRLRVRSTVTVKDRQALALFTGATFQCTAEVIETHSGIVIGRPFAVPVVPESQKDIDVQIDVSIPNARLWTIESPDLYTIKVSLIATAGKQDSLIDVRTVTTGIRTIIRDRNRILFNGAPVTLRGAVWIEDSERYGSAMTYEEMEKDIALIKNLGANVVRIGFNPPHPFIIQLCDRYGLFVLQEIPLSEIPSSILAQETYTAMIEERLKQMIARDKHHPSIIAWGLGDGLDLSNESVRKIISGLHRIVKAEDGRMTYVVSRDPLATFGPEADIAAVQIAEPGVTMFRKSVVEFVRHNPQHPVIVIGVGRPVEKGNRIGYSDPNSQQYQARAIQQRFAAMKETGIVGSLIFSFNDFRSDRPVLRVPAAVPDRHTNGIVELNREKKVAYETVHSLFHNQKLSALPIGSHVPSSPYLYVVIGLALLIAAAWLVNGNRRYRESTRRAIFNSYNLFADIRDQFTLPLFHTTITAVIISVTVAVLFSSLLYQFRSSLMLDYFLSFLFPDALKRIVIRMAWDPAVSVGYYSGVMFVWFLLLTLMIQLLAKIVKVKIRFFHSYSIAVWTALPWTFFIPVGMILYRVLESEAYVPWVLGLIAVVTVWVFFRTLKGISVIFHIYTPKMYMVGIVAVLFLTGGLFLTLEYVMSLSAYVDLFVSTILPFSH